MSEQEMSDYVMYRGKCKEMAEAACCDDPTLTLVRGHYHCPFWGEQPHWWTVRADGTIYDPTAKQFPMGGSVGEYVPFDGMVECAQCGKQMKEEDARFDSRYAFCSTACNMRFVGL